MVDGRTAGEYDDDANVTANGREVRKTYGGLRAVVCATRGRTSSVRRLKRMRGERKAEKY